MLFYVGFPRQASRLAAEQIKNIPQNDKKLKELMQIAEQGVELLCSDGDNLDDFGRLLHAGWQVKRGLARNIATDVVDQAYQAAQQAGALGGKLLGAGSGGFMLLFARPEDRSRIKERLKEFLYVPFRFENSGSQIVFFTHDDYAKDLV